MFDAYILKSSDSVVKVVCPACAKRGEVIHSCPVCGGNGIRRKSVIRFFLAKNPITITKVDRDPKTGVIRYWHSRSEFFYETTTPELNPYVPDVPFGIHFIHSTKEEAEKEVLRINTYLEKHERESSAI